MNADENVLRRAIREATAADRAALHDHPDVEDLLAYQERALPQEEAAAIREHLALCRECTDFVLDLEDFPHLEAREGEPELTEAEHAEDLHALLGTLPAARPVPPDKPTSTPWRAWFPLAAGLLIGALGLGLWLADMGDVEPAVEPAAAWDLFPEEGGRGAVTAIILDPVYPEETRLVLRFNTLGLDRSARYRLEARHGEREVFQHRGLRPDSQGTFTLLVDRSVMPAGEVRVFLLPEDAGDHTDPLAEYRFQVPEL